MNNFVKFITELSEKKKLHIAAYPGNSGDELIMQGIYHCLYKNGEFSNNPADQADIIIFPGGNFSMWESSFGYIKAAIQNYDAKIIIGPSTFDGTYTKWREYLVQNNDRFYALFPRDEISYNNLIKLKLKGTTINKTPDIAFSLSDSKLIKSLINASEENYDLVSLRSDLESGLFKYQNSKIYKKLLPKRIKKKITNNIVNNKIESLGLKNPLIKDVSLLNFSLFCEFIAKARRIYTDRLHVVILCILIKKQVYVFPTKHNKIRGVLSEAINEDQEKFVHYLD